MSSDGGEPAVVRKRFQGSPEDLARALRPFVVKRGVSFCTYAGEAMSPGYSKLVHGDTSIEGQIELLALLRSLSENMAFPRSTLLRALKILQKELRSTSPASKMDTSQISDWAETLQRRIRNCCRRRVQGELARRTADSPRLRQKTRGRPRGAEGHRVYVRVEHGAHAPVASVCAAGCQGGAWLPDRGERGCGRK